MGLNVDKYLTWEKHISSICQKIAGKVNILKKIKHFLPFHVRKIFYNAYILPHFDFCCSIWGGCNKVLLAKLRRLHKFAAYQVLCINSLHSYKNLIARLQWLTVDERIQYRKAISMYKIMNGLAPAYLRDLFVYCMWKILVMRP